MCVTRTACCALRHPDARARSDGAIATVFFLFCLEVGLSELDTGALLTCILLGDLAITLVMSTRADAYGRRSTLLAGSALKVLAGCVFGMSRSFGVLVAAGIVGVISTSGGECGPFIAVEQAALTDCSARLSRWRGASHRRRGGCRALRLVQRAGLLGAGCGRSGQRFWRAPPAARPRACAVAAGGVSLRLSGLRLAMYRFSRMRSDEVGVEPAADALREPLLQAETGEAYAEGGLSSLSRTTQGGEGVSDHETACPPALLSRRARSRLALCVKRAARSALEVRAA
jgi:hypothetical protein